jgi:UDP-N-acetyl-D-mannosaminuronate dehydrogenase
MMRPSQDAAGFWIDDSLAPGQLVCGTCLAVVPSYVTSRMHADWHDTLVTKADG